MTNFLRAWRELLFWVLYGIVLLLSRLPFSVWYRISDAVAALVWYVIRYRKQLVIRNLSRCFPAMPPQAIRQTARTFYTHLCDVMVETLKGATLSDPETRRRATLMNPEVMEAFATTGKSALVLTSHYGNFEYLGTVMSFAQVAGRFQAWAVYSGFKGSAFERILLRIRTRRGLKLIPMHQAVQQVSALLRQSRQLICMVIDQSPSRQKRLHFSPFLGQQSAYHTSAAYLALKSGCPLYVFEMKKPERGFYQIWMHEVDTSAYLPCTPETIRALTDHLAALLARPILTQPAWWLWSHNRWKHQPREGDTVTPVPQRLP